MKKTICTLAAVLMAALSPGCSETQYQAEGTGENTYELTRVEHDDPAPTIKIKWIDSSANLVFSALDKGANGTTGGIEKVELYTDGKLTETKTRSRMVSSTNSHWHKEYFDLDVDLKGKHQHFLVVEDESGQRTKTPVITIDYKL